MFCASCNKEFKQTKSWQIFCDKDCRNEYNAKVRTFAVQGFERETVELCIYEIRCKENDWRYVGLTNDIQKRWKEHLSTLNTNRHINARLQIDFNKYGAEEFELSILLRKEINRVSWGDMQRVEREYIVKNKLRYNEDSIPGEDNDPERIKLNEAKKSLNRRFRASGGRGSKQKAKEEDFFKGE